ncbi:hypothetical protein EJ02DRAFT_457690 [Clathrospora elynae]|uniref:Uncharacterized protein n=1 Tax=Clathrospora elynae TaxID=706981 RepID=A0A6A5SG40_9PLEO|nr:hypothetical protein EJ02DRAFT_457690 [Clathrospora elynae]
MSLKPRSQIAKINSAPPRSQNIAPVKLEEEDNHTANHGAHEMIRPAMGRPQSFQSDVERAQRRSLLPQPGLHRYNTRSSILLDVSEPDCESNDVDHGSKNAPSQSNVASTTPEVHVQKAVPGRLRPRSMYQTGIASSQRAEHGDKTTASRSMRPPTSVSKPAEPQTVGLGRSRSLRKPNATTQSSQSIGPANHTRTQSTSTIIAAPRHMAKPNTGSERPKSLLMAPTRSSKANTVSADTLPSGARTSIRIAGLNRSASTKAKPEASSGSAGTGAALRAEETLTAQPSRREPVLEEPKKTNRPAFSTLQQHFTPRKIGKAATATFLNPAPITGTQSLPPEIGNLQSELLQLHLLHQSSAQVSKRWELSAKRSLHTKFEEVSSLHQIMLDNERAGQEQKNLQSLIEWSTGGSAAGLVEHIRILSEPLHELPSLVESGGRLQRLVGDFEHWLSSVRELQSARQRPSGDKDALETVNSLGDSWRAVNAALTRKLTALVRDLDRLAQPSPGSSIACIVDTCTSILRGILDELQIMQMIEADVVMMEKAWVEDRLRAIARVGGTDSVDTDGQNAAWRV